MTPDPSYTTTVREGENSGWMGWKKKQIHNREQLFRQATPGNYSSTVVGVFRFKITP